jgi:hypothetical protein
LEANDDISPVAGRLLRTNFGKWIYDVLSVVAQEDPSYEIALSILSRPLSISFPERDIKVDVEAQSLAPLISNCLNELDSARAGKDGKSALWCYLHPKIADHFRDEKRDVFSAGIDILEALAAGTWSVTVWWYMGYGDNDAFPNNVEILVDQGSESLKQAFAKLLAVPSVREKVKEWSVDLRPLDKLLVQPAG